MLTLDLTTQEIRVLQEFRRLAADSMTIDQIRAIKHPLGGGEAPARSLVTKGYLEGGPEEKGFTLTEKARQFLSYNPVPVAGTGSR